MMSNRYVAKADPDREPLAGLPVTADVRDVAREVAARRGVSVQQLVTSLIESHAASCGFLDPVNGTDDEQSTDVRP